MYLWENEDFKITEEQAKNLEKQHVLEVYDHIAEHFSETRFKPWPEIASFMSSLSQGSLLVDVGCGNGKYLGRNENLIEIGCDLSQNLLGICKERSLEVAQANILQLPFRNNSADACLCIAVLHHLSTAERRKKAVSEVVRILGIGGKALIYVWSLEQETKDGVKSNYLKNSRCKKSENSPTESLVQDLTVNDNSLSLPVHVNRTKFVQQDLFVPWKSKESVEGQTFHRFYHVFKQGELEEVVNSVNNVKILKSFYDKGNW